MTKIAVVTGSSKGIGQTITEMLLAEGWEVFGVSRTPNAILGENTNFHQIFADLSKIGIIKNVCAALPKKIDLLINNAGRCEPALIKDITPEHFDRIISLNLRAPILLTTSLLPKFHTDSTIINISSVMSSFTEPKLAIYSASKAGLDRFTTTLAKEHKDLKVIGILPAATNTIAKDTNDKKYFLSTKQVARVVIEAANGKYHSGDLLIVCKKEFFEMWTSRDKYIVEKIA